MLSKENQPKHKKNTNKKISIIFGLILLLSLFIPLLNAEVFETYGEEDSTYYSIEDSVHWFSQTFTVGTTGSNEKFNITSVDLFLNRAYYSPPEPTVTVSIKAVDGTGKPTGSDLSTGTITDSFGWNWFNIPMSTYELQASTKYAIVIRVLNLGSTGNGVYLDTKASGSYSGGNFFSSTDSGSSWTSTARDMPFNVNGIAADVTPPTFVNIPANFSSTYGDGTYLSYGSYIFQGTDDDGFGYFKINDSRFTMTQDYGVLGFLTSQNPLPAGFYPINVTINDTSNNINWTIYTVEVNKSTAACSVFFNTTSPITHPAFFRAATNCTTAYTLMKNGTSIANDSSIRSGATAYNISVQRTDTQNYSNTFNQQQFIINKNSETFKVLFNATSPLIYPDVFLAWANATSPFTLMRNGTSISNNSVQRNGVGYFNFSAQRTDTSNYTNNYNETSFTITKSQEKCQVLFNRTSPIMYPLAFFVWGNCTSPFVLSRNGTTITNNSKQSLTVGYYNFSLLRTDATNYTYIYNETNFTINQLDINNTFATSVDVLDVNYAMTTGLPENRNAQNYSAGKTVTHDFTITEDANDHYIMVAYAKLNAILKVYVNDYLVGTIPADAGSSGVWTSKAFLVESAYLLIDNEVKIEADVTNSEPGYIDKIYMVSKNVLGSTYVRNSTVIALYTNYSRYDIDYIALNVTYSNTTNIIKNGEDINTAVNTTYGTLISLFDTEQYNGFINLSVIVNSTSDGTLSQTGLFNITTDNINPLLVTITTTLSNVLTGRTYNLTLNQTEVNPDYVKLYLNGVLQGSLFHNLTNTEMWNTTITYLISGTNNITLSSYDLAGNYYNYTFNVALSLANITQENVLFNQSFAKVTAINTTSTDTYYNKTLKFPILIHTEGLSNITDYNINGTISDTYPLNIYALLDNGTTINKTTNETNPNWTTDRFDNSLNGTINFYNYLVYDIVGAIRVKHGDAGVGNERLVWVKLNNVSSTTNLTNIWFKFPIRTAYSEGSYSIQMKVCNAGQTYGLSTCSSWSITTTTLYSETSSTYNEGEYPTVDTDGDGTKDTIYFKVPYINQTDTILYSFDTIAVAETAWATGTGGSSGGDPTKPKTNETNETTQEDKELGAVDKVFSSVGQFLDKYILSPITKLVTSVTTKWNDTIGFFVITSLILVSGVILIFSNKGNSQRIKKSDFTT